MRIRGLALALALALLIAGAAPARARAAQEVHEYTLDNGLTVLIQEDHRSPLAVFMIWYRVGSVDERSGQSGMSHLLEHMMFKGTGQYPSKVLSRTVMKHGGMDNAFTSKDYTAYFQELPSDRIELSMRFESDRMRGLAMTDEDVRAERDVVMEERRLRYEDVPETSLYEEVVAAAYKVHPYRWPVIGWMQDLRMIEREALYEHYDRYYSPENATIVIVGDVLARDAMEMVRAHFGPIPRYGGGGSAAPGPKPQEPPQRGQRRVSLRREAQFPYVLMAYHVPQMPHEDAYALDVLATVLGGGESARLYRGLVYEGRLAQGADAEYDGVSREPALFYLDAKAAPGVGPEALEAALVNAIAGVVSDPPSDRELQKAKNQIEASFIMGQDSIMTQASMLGSMAVTGGWRQRDSYLEGIRAVTSEDVARVAARYLSWENSTVGVLIPEGGGTTAGAGR